MKKVVGKNSNGSAGRHIGVLLEQMDSKLDLLVEGHEALDKKIEDLKEHADERFDGVDYKFGIVLDELHIIRNELKEKIGRDEFIVLEKRVAALEKKADSSRSG